ncbi:hypothetical protein [Haloplanus salilacus]
MAFELSDRPDDLSETFAEADELLSAELDELVERDGVDHGFQ